MPTLRAAERERRCNSAISRSATTITRTTPARANQLIADILDEAVYAEEVGLHSAWIGEHHFSTLGVLSCPDLVLAQVAARTKKIRLAPAVTVLPLHHPIRVAEQWATLDMLSGGRVDFAAGRGYDRREYGPLGASFEDNQAIFEEGFEIVQRLWASAEPLTHHGKHYRFDDVAITPQPVQRPIPAYVASFSKPSIELAARLGCNLIVAPFAAAMTFGGLQPGRAMSTTRPALRHGNKPGRLMCSYFLHFADTRRRGGRRARAADPLLQGMRDRRLSRRPRRPRRRATAISSRSSTGCSKVQPQDLTENSVLLGSPGADHRHAEKGRGRRLRRGHPLRHRRPQAARPGQGRDGPLHGRGGAGLRRLARRALHGQTSQNWPV